LQGGKVLGNHISLASFVGGIPLFIIGFIALIGSVLDFGFPSNTAVIIAAVLVTLIGVLLIISGFSTFKT
jgi:putative Mn2+ efflux pump MntP